jgi:predicted NBD/HSP70 family sugar kinase
MAYDPDKIILGGGVSQAGSIFLQSILHEWHKQASSSPLAAELLKPAKLELAPRNRNLGAWGGIGLIKENYSQTEPSAYYTSKEVVAKRKEKRKRSINK